MKEFDIAAYIEGELTGAKLEAFEAEMRRNPAFAREVQYFQRLTEDVETQALREEVNRIVSATPPLPKPGISRWLAGFGLLLLLLVAGYFFFLDDKAPEKQRLPSLEPPLEMLEEEPSSPLEKPVEEEKEAPEKEKNPPLPIAETQPPADLPPPLHPAPNLRGNQQDSKAWKAMMDKIWYTDYPPSGVTFGAPFLQVDQQLKKRNFSKAYVRLQVLERSKPENDTLRYLKGYCLLEMGEGMEALSYFKDLDEKQPAWKAHVEWNRGLAYLLAGRTPEAVGKFKEISGIPEHPFRRQSEKALELLE